MGLADRNAAPDELERMRGLVRQGMLDGAFGVSTGLFYVPGAFTRLAEVVELQKIVAPWRGVHTSHMRDAATFEEPHQYAAGFSHVIVNGQVVCENGAMTAARPGKVLYGPGKR